VVKHVTALRIEDTKNFLCMVISLPEKKHPFSIRLRTEITRKFASNLAFNVHQQQTVRAK